MAGEHDCDIIRDDSSGWLSLTNFNSDNDRPAVSEQKQI